MFFLLRMAFWLGLVLVLLPREKTPESDKLPQVGASEAVSAATAAVSDMSQFCKRQPAACEVGGQAATVIGHRAQDGARKLYQIITDKKSADHTGSKLKNNAANPTRITAMPCIAKNSTSPTRLGCLLRLSASISSDVVMSLAPKRRFRRDVRVRKALIWRERNDRPCSATGQPRCATGLAVLCGFVMVCASARMPRQAEQG